MKFFFKVHGAGNDFLVMDGRLAESPSKEQIRQLCHRRLGVGSDGLIVIKPDDQADFRMEYFNADGSRAQMCGNGARSAVAFAYRQGFFSQKQCKFVTDDGLHEGQIVSENFPVFNVRVDIFQRGELKEVEKNVWFVHTGVPHVVVLVDDVDIIDVRKEALTYRFREDLAENGVNVNFIDTSKGLRIRTYERGVEDETLSCGTGVSASAWVAHKLNLVVDSTFEVHARGGDFLVEITSEKLWLTGPVTFVASCEVFG